MPNRNRLLALAKHRTEELGRTQRELLRTKAQLEKAMQRIADLEERLKDQHSRQTR